MLGAKYRLAVIKRPRVLLAPNRQPCGADVNIWSKGQKGLFPYLFMLEAPVSRLKGCHPSQLSVEAFHRIAFLPRALRERASLSPQDLALPQGAVTWENRTLGPDASPQALLYRSTQGKGGSEREKPRRAACSLRDGGVRRTGWCLITRG